jgi:hypothetical protein
MQVEVDLYRMHDGSRHRPVVSASFLLIISSRGRIIGHRHARERVEET